MGDKIEFLYPKNEFAVLKDHILKEMVAKEQLFQQLIEDRKILKDYIEKIQHQIKTPITGIGLLLDCLEQQPNKQGKFLPHIRTELNRLEDLTGVLLKMSSLETNIQHFKKEKISVYSIVLDVLHNLESFTFKKEINIFGEDFYIIGDDFWIMEGLFNLLKNALEVSKDLPVEIHLEENKIYKSIIVRDFTKGIPLDKQPFIYDRFYKIDPNSKGFGLGLAMVKTIMDESNGEILYHLGKKHNDFEMRFFN